GSLPGKRGNRTRGWLRGHLQFIADYFGPDELSLGGEAEFTRTYGITFEMFDTLCNVIAAYDAYFRQTRDAFGKLGISTQLKICIGLEYLRTARAYKSNSQYL
ncbi:uncharacterized protein EV422DRAFT_480845, partial [Fimicolochytrium jonesii]|uniref:uncharacterized protein n=1 Tax=Fimicolochytrium jonesii TaxID=1396493 RepID=UPI0022FE7C25